MSDITAVTGLYDIGREQKGDGRRFDWYVEKLNQTLRIPLPFIVFLDPTFDASKVEFKPQDRLVRVAIEDFALMRLRDRVEAICRTAKGGDLTFKLPLYGLLVTSKLDMVKRAAALTDSPALLWADAGISHFLPDLSQATLDPSVLRRFDGIDFAVNATPDLAAIIKAGRLPKGLIGTSRALLNAGDIYFRRTSAPQVADAVLDMIENEWLPNGLWDNEQVSLGCLILKGTFNVQLAETSFYYGNITRIVFGLPTDVRPPALRDHLRLFRTRYTAGLTKTLGQYEASAAAKALLRG